MEEESFDALCKAADFVLVIEDAKIEEEKTLQKRIKAKVDLWMPQIKSCIDEGGQAEAMAVFGCLAVCIARTIKYCFTEDSYDDFRKTINEYIDEELEIAGLVGQPPRSSDPN